MNEQDLDEIARRAGCPAEKLGEMLSGFETHTPYRDNLLQKVSIPVVSTSGMRYVVGRDSRETEKVWYISVVNGRRLPQELWCKVRLEKSGGKLKIVCVG